MTSLLCHAFRFFGVTLFFVGMASAHKYSRERLTSQPILSLNARILHKLSLLLSTWLMLHLINRRELARHLVLEHWGSEERIVDLKVTNVAANGFVSGRFSREDGSFLFGMNVDKEEKVTRPYMRKVSS